jgi:ppGpp synthetase/RelA/SpoT-type nucleotidyltranferase
MAKPLKEKIQRLIDRYYPWGQSGYLPTPASADPEVRESGVSLWIEEQTLDFRVVGLTLIARILPVLREIESRSSAVEGVRLLARIDSSALVKSPASILEKMVRDWEPDSLEPPRFTFENFRQELKDLGRFRIVANFLGDARLIAQTLAAPYSSPLSPQSPALAALKDEFNLEQNRFENSVILDPASRKKGERCHKGVFYPRFPHQQHLRVEVQIQTQLQEAWDKKDHFLVYEPRRRGEEVALDHRCEIFAMSELLYVADLTFDRLRQKILNSRPGSTESRP